MNNDEGHTKFRALSKSEKKRLFLDFQKTPPFVEKGSWGEWFHSWLEDQAAEGRCLGEIEKRVDLPPYLDCQINEPWFFLERHVGWLIQNGYARVVRIEVLS